MRIMISVGWSHEIGGPDLGSLAATCDVHYEIDEQVLDSDPESFVQGVKNACAVCRKAVEEELACHGPDGTDNGEVNSAREPSPPSAASPSGGDVAKASGSCGSDGYRGSASFGP